MTLRLRLVLALGSLATATIGLSIALLLLAIRVRDAVDDVRHDEQASHDAMMLGVAVREQYMHEAHTLIESTRDHLPHHHTWVEQVSSGARDLGSRVPAPERWRLRRIPETSAEIARLFRGSLLPAMERGEAGEVASQHRRIDELVSQAAGDADALAVALELRMRAAHARAEQATRTAAWVAALGSLLVLALAAWHAVQLRRHAIRPLSRLVAATRQIAAGEINVPRGEGDLEVRAVEVALARMSAELRERQDRLLSAERMAVLGQMSAGIAHEVNNPIGIIRGYLRTMIPEARDDEQRRELEILDEEAAACQRIAEDLVAFARSGELRLVEVDLAALIEETARRLSSSRAIGDARLERDVEPAVLRIDAGRIRQVVENLVRNAVQVSGSGAVVELIGRREETGYRLEVRDRGPGLDAEDRERVFEPFFTRRSGGSGLGLAVCLGVVRAHGGTIETRSREGGGAVFSVALPDSSAAPRRPS